MTLNFLPFVDLPWPAEILLAAAFFSAWIQLALVIGLSIRGGDKQHLHLPPTALMPAHEDEYLWVFLVPALNEEVTISDTIDHLLRVRAAHRTIVVIDDGSDDATPRILRERPEPEVQVLTRRAPEARTGKSAALNAAWQALHEGVITSPVAEFGEDRVLVVIVDADGRLDEGFAEKVAPYFTDPQAGGLQVCVRIYNRQKVLTYMQDLEFRVFDDTYQLGCSPSGNAVLGGNGQVTRMSALSDVAQHNRELGWSGGPWRKRLTEDQDLGLSLLICGYRNSQDMKAYVDQQGLSSFRRLMRQRTRWAQGNIEAMSRAGEVLSSPMHSGGKVTTVYLLFQPIVQLIIGLSIFVALFLAVFDPLAVLTDVNWWIVIPFMMLTLGGTVIGVIRAQLIGVPKSSVKGWVIALGSVLPYVVYIWLLLPAIPLAFVKHIRRESSWAKTEREPIIGSTVV